MQKEEGELGIGELSFGRDTDEPIFRSQSPELDEQEKNLRMHAVNAEWVLMLRRGQMVRWQMVRWSDGQMVRDRKSVV